MSSPFPESPRQQIWNGIEVEHMGKPKVVREVENSSHSIQGPLLKRRFLNRCGIKSKSGCVSLEFSVACLVSLPSAVFAKRHQCQEAIAEMLRNLIFASSIGNHKHRDPLFESERSGLAHYTGWKNVSESSRSLCFSVSLSLSLVLSRTRFTNITMKERTTKCTIISMKMVTPLIVTHESVRCTMQDFIISCWKRYFERCDGIKMGMFML